MHLGAVYNRHRHTADLREAERKMSSEKRTLVSLIIPQSVELLKGPKFGGIQFPTGRRNWCQPRVEEKQRGMRNSVGKAW